jgi:class 3 adenylate cyclase
VRRGAEEITRRINAVYDALIGAIERYGGSVISFAGDLLDTVTDATGRRRRNITRRYPFGLAPDFTSRL